MHPTMCVCIHCTIPCALQVPGKASRDAVLRILKAEGFASIVAMRKPLLSTVNKRKRKQFALGHRGYDWGNVVWSDEKVFNVRPGEKVRCWWRRSGNKYAAKYVRTTVAHPQSLMVWAAMDSSGGICLRRCPPRVNAVKYQELLGTALSFIRRRCVPDAWAILLGTCVYIAMSFPSHATGVNQSGSCRTEPHHTEL